MFKKQKQIIKKTSLLLGSVILLLFPISPVLADQLDNQIQALQNKIDGYNSQISKLQQQQDTLANKIASLNDQINSTVARIQLLAAKATKVQQDLNITQQKLDTQKSILDENVKTIYTSSASSSLEILFSSNNFSDFVDREEYLDKTKEKIVNTINAINVIKKQLEDQKLQLASLIAAQKIQQQQLQSQRNEQSNILAQTQGQESNYQQLVANNNKQLQALYAERARIDAQNGVGVVTGGTGGYPYANGAIDVPDPWGFLTRECTSYVAWKRRAVGKLPYPYMWGNAGSWMYAVPTTTTAGVGDIAVFPPGVGGAGYVGHVAYVERVNSNGTMDVSEFNWRPYAYTYRSGVPTGGVQFIE